MSVVLVTVDSLRADHVGCYGYHRDTSPNIDRLATEGLFVDAYAHANATRASFPTILTSTYPLAYGGYEYLSDRRTLVSSPLQSAGYTTAGFHSNVWLSRDFNYNRGFDRFYDSKSDPGLLARLRLFAKTNLDHDGLVYRLLQRLYDRTERESGLDIGQTYKNAKTVTDLALEWIDGVDQPFFLWVHYMDVHHPYIPRPEQAAEMGVDLGIGERDAIQLRRKMLEQPENLTDGEQQTLVDLYDAEIRYTDEQIGRLVDRIEADFDGTTVLVTSDHGEEFAEHGGFSHNPSMYDEVLHVPLVLSGKRIEADGYDKTSAQLLDIAPTILDVADADLPDNYCGQSVRARVLDGKDATIISEVRTDGGLRLSVRKQGWKYIWDQGNGTQELYNLAEDPGETKNINADKSEKAAQLHTILEEHISELAETNEQLPEVRIDAETERRLKDLGYLE